MQIYLPIAELSMNVFLVLGMGAIVGFLSGMFGVGGGFLITPLLIFVNIPPAIAVATGATLIVGSSVSGVLAHWRRGTVDVKMGTVLLLGGIAGTGAGVWLFQILQGIGQVDLMIYILYVVFLGSVGVLMLYESVKAILRRRAGRPVRRPSRHGLAHKLPLQLRFRRSRLYVSIIPPLLIGFGVGALAGAMGIGGGFIMVPAMIYLIGMPTSVVVGTSLFQIIFVSASASMLHAVNTQAVDVVLALMLLAGAVVGAQFGARMGGRMQGEQLRAALGLVVLAVGVGLLVELVARPGDLYEITVLGS